MALITCSQCGHEISDKANHCPHCGKKVEKKFFTKTRIIIGIIGILAVVAIILSVYSIYIHESKPAITEKIVPEKVVAQTEKIVPEKVVAQGYVDLGLPSSTSWKDKNEDGGFYTYEQAVSKFGKSLPTKEQLEELQNNCQWTWTGGGYKVVGPNGQSIYLPAAGYRGCDGSVDGVGSGGYYWSSTPNDSEYAWYLNFGSGDVGMGFYRRCYGFAVRLVQD